MKRTVYLAGPIAGKTEEEAKSWRKHATDALDMHNIQGISPLRCEPPKAGIYDSDMTVQSDCQKFGSHEAIMAKNDFDVRNCDMGIFYIPEGCVGTLIELGMAKMANMGVIVVTEAPRIAFAPLVMHCAGWILPNFDDAIDVVIGVLEDYT